MIQWPNDIPVYLHRDVVDFRKSINGLSLIVSEQMHLSPFTQALFVFCNRQHDKLKVLYWDHTGFALWYKRLEKETFKWPRQHDNTPVSIEHEQWCWLLRGLDFSRLTPHKTCQFSAIN